MGSDEVVLFTDPRVRVADALDAGGLGGGSSYSLRSGAGAGGGGPAGGRGGTADEGVQLQLRIGPADWRGIATAWLRTVLLSCNGRGHAGHLVTHRFPWLPWVPPCASHLSGEPPSLVVYYYPDASCGPKALGCAPVIVHFKRHNPKLTWSKGVWCGAPLVRPRGPV